MRRDTGALWRRWVAANALSELFGLGLTLAATGFFFSRLESFPGVTGVLLSFAAAVVSGAWEATIVGWAQWWAMHPWFPGIRRFAWWRATLIGALLAYVLGYLPSTLMNLGEQAAETPVAEPPQVVVLLLAAALGLVAGAILSFAQWLVLRRHTTGAGVWVPANMLAWVVGMPLVFAGIDAAFKLRAIWQAIVLMALVLLLTGAIVGAIHGAFLVRLAERAD